MAWSRRTDHVGPFALGFVFGWMFAVCTARNGAAQALHAAWMLLVDASDVHEASPEGAVQGVFGVRLASHIAAPLSDIAWWHDMAEDARIPRPGHLKGVS
jgi:hypothetical protein